MESVFHSLRARQILVYSASAPLNDHIYGLTEEGRQRTQSLMNACAYVGPAPVPLADYVVSVNAQTIRAEAPRRDRLEQAFADISVDSNLFADLGPAVNSGAGLFLYGAPGNGKVNLGPADYQLLRPVYLDSVRADRGRAVDQALRLGLSRGGERRLARHRPRAPITTAAGSRSGVRRWWSAAK